MNEQYSNVCTKILENYPNYLTEKEIIAIKKIIKLNNYDNFNIIIFINKIVDRIWNMTLTNPKQFINGKSFTFLVTRDIIPIEFNPKELINLEKKQKHFLELVTHDSIIESSVGINGIIVEIDYINSFSDIVLPCDFIEQKRILANTKLNIQAVFNTSLELGNFDAEEELSNDFASHSNLIKININKALYNYKKNNKILTKNDKDMLANIIIVYYLIENNYDKKFEVIVLREFLKRSYKEYIYKEYIKYFNKKISLDEFMTNIFNTLENEPTLQMFDKTM